MLSIALTCQVMDLMTMTILVTIVHTAIAKLVVRAVQTSIKHNLSVQSVHLNLAVEAFSMMRKIVGTRADTPVGEHNHNCSPILRDSFHRSSLWSSTCASLCKFVTITPFLLICTRFQFIRCCPRKQAVSSVTTLKGSTFGGSSES